MADPEVLTQREIRALWAAQLLSFAGNQFGHMAIAVLVYDQTRSALLTAVAYALTCLPLLSGLAARRSPGSVAPGSPGGPTAAR